MGATGRTAVGSTTRERRWVRARPGPITDSAAIAGRYADQGRYGLIDTGRHGFPSLAEVPASMDDFARWLAMATDTPDAAFAAVWIFIRSTMAMDARRYCL